MNFFGEKHGKNGRDTHFSVISRYIHDESLVRQLNSSQDIAEAIQVRQRLSNDFRIAMKKKPITTIVYVLSENYLQELNIVGNPVQSLHIRNVDSFYNYKTFGNNLNLVTTIMSNRVLSIPVELLRE